MNKPQKINGSIIQFNLFISTDYSDFYNLLDNIEKKQINETLHGLTINNLSDNDTCYYSIFHIQQNKILGICKIVENNPNINVIYFVKNEIYNIVIQDFITNNFKREGYKLIIEYENLDFLFTKPT